MVDPEARLRDALADRYALERELGRGGMATVYLARDLKHDRLVALKVLRPELAAALGAERFLREIRLTAALDHPLTLPVLDSGEAAGVVYYTMPYVEGESLRNRLDREGQLPLEDAVAITREVADALAYAHSRGIIHRDIKPENILLSGGHARVADFGIARAVTEAGGEKLTETGLAIGTPAYMSPEQAEGAGRLDARSDLYSLGCVLYEMLAGHPPFHGTTAHEMLARHALDPVPPLKAARKTIPAPIEAAIERALEKTPADRFATATQFSQALTIDATAFRHRTRIRAAVRHVALGGVALVTIAGTGYGLLRSRAASGWKRVPLDSGVVAVMPFRVAAVDPALAALGEGVMDLLFPLLSGDAGLRAVSPSELLLRLQDRRDRGRASGADASLRLAAEFGAGLIIEGAAVQAGPQVTLNAWLRRVPGGEQVAQYSVSGSADTINVLVTQLALGLLGARLGEDRDRLEALSRRPPAAVAAYLTGIRAWREWRGAEAADAFRRALALDSTFALAALRVVTAGGAGGSPRYLRTARAHRDQLGRRERAEVDFLCVLTNTDTTGMGAATLEAARRWADVAPDNSNALLEYGSRLPFFAGLLGIPDWEAKMRDAWQRAWNLDSTTFRLVTIHLRRALMTPDLAWARRVAPRFLAIADTSNEALLGERWSAAQVVGDTVLANRLARRVALSTTPGTTGPAVSIMLYTSFALGLPLEAIDTVMTHVRADIHDHSDSNAIAYYLMWGGLARGRPTEAVAALASPMGDPQPWTGILEWWLAYPGLDSAAAWAAGEARRVAASDSGTYVATCYVELYRAARGDTIGARDAARGLMSRYQRDGRPGVCPAMVEAFVESHDRNRSDTPALDRFEAILRQAPFPERNQPDGVLGTAGPTVLARLRRQRGQLDRALAASRIHLTGQFYLWYQVPLAKEEGDLALMTGDTASAIRAYTRYLALRTDPDSGPVRDEWEHVKTTLDRLLRARG